MGDGLSRRALGWPEDHDPPSGSRTLAPVRDAARPDGERVCRETIAGRYALLEPIGHGGTSTVWEARDLQAQRHVALKLMRCNAPGGARLAERFRREVDLASQLSGSSFVRILDSGIVSDRAFLVMELLEGESLQQRLARVHTLGRRELLELCAGLHEALSLAHQIEIIHRDIKPGNIFYARATTSAGQGECVKLLDLGIAKDLWSESRLTSTNTFLGSTHYMSPEQLRSGRDVDTSADLWSTSVVLYRALTGAVPFTGRGLEAATRVKSSSFIAPSHVMDGEVSAFDAFFTTAFARRPSDRFGTIDDLCAAFVAALNGSRLCTARPRQAASPRVFDPRVTAVGALGYVRYATRASAGVPDPGADTPTAIVEPYAPVSRARIETDSGIVIPGSFISALHDVQDPDAERSEPKTSSHEARALLLFAVYCLSALLAMFEALLGISSRHRRTMHSASRSGQTSTTSPRKATARVGRVDRGPGDTG